MFLDRAIIIRRRRVELSQEYAEECRASCEKHGLAAEFLDGIEFMTSDQAFQAAGVWRQESYIGTTGHNNCHASHILAWRRLIEIDRPCVIMEHDAIVKGDITQVDIPDMALVTFGFRLGHERFYEPVGPFKELLEIPRSIGVHACAMTPTTARWLVEKYEQEGVGENLDKALMMDRTIGLPLYVADPPQVVCWPRMSTREWQEVDRERREMAPNWNMFVTESWRKGLKLHS